MAALVLCGESCVTEWMMRQNAGKCACVCVIGELIQPRDCVLPSRGAVQEKESFFFFLKEKKKRKKSGLQIGRDRHKYKTVATSRDDPMNMDGLIFWWKHDDAWPKNAMISSCRFHLAGSEYGEEDEHRLC